MRPELVIQESGRCHAHPIAGGHPLCLGGPEHRQGTPGASGAGALCCTRLSIALLLLPFPSSLLGFCPSPPPSPLSAGTPSCVWHSPWQGFSPPSCGAPPTKRGIRWREGHNTPKPVTHPSAPPAAAGALSRANESSELTLIIISKLTSG